MSQKNRLRKVFLAIVKFHKMSQMSQPNVTPATFSVRKIDYGLWNIPVKTDTNSTQKKNHPPKGRFCPSIDLVCKVEKSALENSSVSFRRSTFRVSFLGFMQKRPRNCDAKLSVANSFNEGKLDRRLFKL